MENITPTSNRSHHPYNGNHSVSGGGREDCWSEGATATLIDAWGDRYLQLSRGNLRQKDWKEVADAVNSRQDSIKKPRKTDVQCKNRIDTIKKKYKLERSKPLPSKWPFYSHLDQLIGTPPPKLKPPPLPQHPSSSSAVNFSVRKLNPNPIPNHYNSSPVIYSGGSSSRSRLNSSPFGSTGSSHDGVNDDDDDDDEEDLMVDIGVGGGGSRSRSRSRSRKSNGVIGNSVPNDDREAFREIAKAIVKFGEVYERIESSKQQQIMELERQRMEFTKDLEFQRMQMFMEAQLELEKTKRTKYAPGVGEN